MGLSLPSCSTPSGDHVHFFNGEEYGEEVGNDNESMTGTCVTFLPCCVCIVATSNRLGLFPESLIFGIGRLVYAGRYKGDQNSFPNGQMEMGDGVEWMILD